MTIDADYVVGVDWGTVKHRVCVVAASGREVQDGVVEQTPEALGTWVTQLLARVAGDATRLAVAIEVPRGPVVELLLERGIPTYSVNPAQLASFRQWTNVAGAKDDRRDARALTQAWRADPTRFRQVLADDPQIIELREWSRLDAELGVELGRLTNRLREQWQRYYPQLLTLSPAATDAWVWRLWEHAPTPAAGASLAGDVIASVVHSYRLRKWKPDAVQAVLRTPALVVAPGTLEAARAHAQYLIERLWLLRRQQESCTAQLEALLTTLREPPEPPGDGGPTDAAIVCSQPGIGPVVASRLLAEPSALWQVGAFAAVRSWAGIAPVTRQSGKTRLVLMRHACNGALRDAFFYWARASVKCNAASRAYYQTLRARGHTYGRALRAVADRLLRILISCLTHRTLYAAPTPARTPTTP